MCVNTHIIFTHFMVQKQIHYPPLVIIKCFIFINYNRYIDKSAAKLIVEIVHKILVVHRWYHQQTDRSVR